MNSLEPARVLIVEDDPEMREALAQLLCAEGYQVEVANDGAEAIDLLQRDDKYPSVVLLDLLMPGLVGQEVLEFLQSDERLGAVPVAIVSGSPQLAPDGYAVFAKPIALNPLLTFLRERCGLHHDASAAIGLQR
jgi:CheY-like chemotaxis protein